MVRILKAREVADLLDFADALACIERSFLDQADDGVTAWPPSSMRSGSSMLMLRSGGLGAQGRLGVRVTTGPYQPSYALVFDAPSGDLLTFMAYPFSELRLHATVALAVDRLANPKAGHIGLLGSGRNAPGLLQAICRVRPVESVKVFSPTAEHRARFADRASESLSVPVTPVNEPQEAVESADIVLVATNATAPALQGAWLAPGTHVAAIGDRRELDEEVFTRADLLVTTSRVQEMNVHGLSDAWPLVRLTQAGKVNWDDVIELGEVVAGRVARPRGISVLREAQGGFGDVALAALAYERAVERGRGFEWTPLSP